MITAALITAVENPAVGPPHQAGVESRGMRQLFRKLVCFLLDHVDEVTNVKPHIMTCTCRLGGGHGDVSYECKRCGRQETHSELIC